MAFDLIGIHTVSAKVALEFRADSKAPAADPSFHCVSRTALWGELDRPAWASSGEVGVALPACEVSRGSVTGGRNV